MFQAEAELRHRFIAKLPGVAIGVVVIVALLDLAGWTLDVQALRTLPHGGRVPMNPATAISFLLCAVTLWLLREPRPLAPAARACVLAGGLLVILIALSRLGVAVGAGNFRFDTALFKSRLRGNSMAPNAAAAFILVATALLTLDVRAPRQFHLSQALTLVVASIAALSLVGYIYNIAVLYAVRGAVPMALSTALMFFVISGGMLCSRPEREPLATLLSPSFGGVIARCLMPGAVIIPLALGGMMLIGWQHDLFNPTLGMTLFVLSIMLIFTTLIWWAARVIRGSDLQRQEKHAQLEKALEAKRWAMEKLQLAQSALVQTEKLASLGQMVAGVAHEINNPLSFVGNNVAVVQRDTQQLCNLISLYARADEIIAKANPELAQELRGVAERMDLAYTQGNLATMLQRSREGLGRIQQIVKDLRDFARLDESDFHEVDLNDGIKSTVNIVTGRAWKKQVRVEMDLQPIRKVMCAPAKINQVVMNLVANAIDAAPTQGTVRIQSQQHQDSARIIVSDNGPGVPKAIRDRIFDPFFTTKPQGEGTGLGLSISYGIVNDHAGRIEVSDAPQGGAVFTVTLPVAGPSPQQGKNRQ